MPALTRHRGYEIRNDIDTASIYWKGELVDQVTATSTKAAWVVAEQVIDSWLDAR